MCHLIVRQQTWPTNRSTRSSPGLQVWESRMRFPSLVSARRHLQAVGVTNSGDRYSSFLASTAHAMRANLLAKAAGDVFPGTTPNQAENSRPLTKAAPLPMAAITAIAVSGSMPGIATSHRQASFRRPSAEAPRRLRRSAYASDRVPVVVAPGAFVGTPARASFDE